MQMTLQLLLEILFTEENFRHYSWSKIEVPRDVRNSEDQ